MTSSGNQSPAARLSAADTKKSAPVSIAGGGIVIAAEMRRLDYTYAFDLR
jgi:hypothetical protein